jgi:antirestriction protein
MTTTSCRIYVASLSDYNAGILHGRWVDVTDEDSIREEIAEMLAESPTAKQEGSQAEEWAIHDHEGFGQVHVSECHDLEDLCSIAAGVEEYGEAFLAWAANSSGNTDSSDFQDAFHGEWDSLADYVQDYWEQCGEMPEPPKNAWWHPANPSYIDWDRMAHDLEMSGDVWTADAPGGKVWVFSNQ